MPLFATNFLLQSNKTRKRGPPFIRAITSATFYNSGTTTVRNARITVGGYNGAGTAKTLSAETIYQGNSDEQPEAVKPVESTVQAKAGTLEHAFPPSSVTVIRLRR